jgi:hypothetical protein
MNIIQKFRFFAYLLLFLTATSSCLAQSFKTEYVVILVIDGPRFSETFGDSSLKCIPKMGRILSKEGVLYSNFKNNGRTYTISGHTAITTGIYQSISNNGRHFPKQPSIFQHYLKEKSMDKENAYIISSKGKLEVLANTRNKSWRNSFMPMTYCGTKGNGRDYSDDIQTINKVYETLNDKPPHILLINLLAVDYYGHANNWENYKSAIQNCDKYSLELWEYIQNHPKMKDKTSLFITNDHGRHIDGHKDGFVNHGDQCLGCKKIFLLALGPDFKKNVVFDKERELIDIPQTIAYLLNFSLPNGRGKVMNELFK